MAERLVIDPVTRVEGQLRVEVEVDSGIVRDAWVSGTVARGFEQILLKKDLRDVPIILQRVCGFCAASHGINAVSAIDSLLGVDLPENARLMRNLLLGADFISSHIIRFYQFIILDYLDVGSVLNYSGIESNLLSLKKKVIKASSEGDMNPFKPSLGVDEYTVNDPAMTTLLITHYFESLEMRKKAHQMAALLGGRMPGYVGVIPGGVTHLLSSDEMSMFRHLLSNLAHWINNIFLPDVIALATGPLLALGQQGIGRGRANFLSFGVFDLDRAGSNKLLPEGAIFNGELAKKEKVDSGKIKESIKYSWYRKARTNRYDLNKQEAYSFVKAPRYKGKPMEVGPLARMLIRQDETLLDLMKDFGIQVGVVARYLALALESKLIAEAMIDWLDELLENTKKTKKIWDKRVLRPEGGGVGFIEAPSGALRHAMEVRRGRISNYRLVSPTSWNASPRDDQKVRGPLEEALIKLAVRDTKSPLSVLRVIHSFNLCMSCGTH